MNRRTGALLAALVVIAGIGVAYAAVGRGTSSRTSIAATGAGSGAGVQPSPAAVPGGVAATGSAGDGITSDVGIASGPTASGVPVPATSTLMPTHDDPALQRWAGFPVDADPRVPILTGETVLIPRDGFSPGEDKISFLSDKFATPALGDDTSTEDGYPTVSSRDAWNLLLSQGNPKNDATGAPTLHVGPLHLGTARFETDRGERTLPAWLTRIDGLDGDVAIAAIRQTARALTDPSSDDVNSYLAVGSGGVTRGADGRTLSFRVSGEEHPAGCDGLGLPTVRISESETAVELALVYGPDPATSAASGGCDAMARFTTISVRLPDPLGNRVLVDEDGDAVTVHS